MKRSHRSAALLLCVGLLAAPVFAYRVYLKDGSSISVREKYQVEGDRAIMVLNSGALTSIPLDEIDVERTEEANKMNFGTSLTVIDDSKQKVPVPQEESTGKTLQDLIRRKQAIDRERDATPRQVRRTEAGFIDLEALPKKRLANDAQVARLGESLRRNGVATFDIWAGSAPGRALVEIVADTNPTVLAAIDGAAKCFAELQSRGAAPKVLEVLVRSSKGERAAMVPLSSENAQLLAKGRLDVGEFFLEYVQF